jgi:TRAP-type C4-dicarboxylate transport system permease small subunit|tara:strand:- start:188 stop:682 length:495 start_codon:yes stop_codon:yes gene_type:complete
MNILRVVNSILSKIAMTLATCIIFIMVAALTLSASTRFFTGSGFAWFIELPPVLVSWLVFPLLGPLLKKGQHIQVDFITSLLSEKSKKILNISVNLVALISACVFFKAGYDATLLFFNLGQLLEIEIDVPIWWMYLAFPVGFFILGLVAIELLIENIKDLLKLN